MRKCIHAEVDVNVCTIDIRKPIRLLVLKKYERLIAKENFTCIHNCIFHVYVSFQFPSTSIHR